MGPSFHVDSFISKRVPISLILAIMLVGCAQLSISPQSVQPPDAAVASRALEAELLPPTEIVVCDFEFSPSSVRENSSPLHRVIDLFRRSSAEERHSEIGRAATARLSDQTLKRLNKLGLTAVRIPCESNESLPGDVLLVTGRLIDANEGDRLTRVALGFGAGESSLDTEVHVFRLAHGERVEVLAFTTHADSGKMPGLLPSMGVGEFFIGPITAISEGKDIASSGLTIYSTQIDYLAGKTGDQVARYLSQYAAKEGWIPQQRAKSVRLARLVTIGFHQNGTA
jgi:Domain of unknown function (DUF4410)